MSDQEEETLVLNYLDFDSQVETIPPTGGKTLDENQNTRPENEIDSSPVNPTAGIKESLAKSSPLKRTRKEKVPEDSDKEKPPVAKRTRNGSLKLNIFSPVAKKKGKQVIKTTSNQSVNNNEGELVKAEAPNNSEPSGAKNNIEVKSEKAVTPQNECKSEANGETSVKSESQLGPKINTLYKVIDLKVEKPSPLKNIFKCEQCLYVGNSKANMERHALIHKNPDEILWFQCSECDYKSKYEHQLKSHTLVHKKPNEIEYFQCPHCEVKCSRKHNLRNHIRSIHSDRVNNLQCAECDYSTFSKDRLVAHIRKHSKEMFACNLCKFVTKRKDYLNNHFNLKHTDVDKPFLCDTCSYKGKTKRELNRHYLRMHNTEKLQLHQCDICDFSSIYKKNFEFHMLHMHKNSEGFQKYICGHCFKEFLYKNGLKTHIIRIHLKFTEEDWHKCQECKYKCKDINTLKRHIKRNHGAPRLHCDQCDFATNRQKSMIAHKKTHEVDVGRILKCPHCPYRIIQAVSFIYHMKTLHEKIVGSKDLQKYYLKDSK